MLNLIAHAGHGHTEGQSLLHWLIEPTHLPLTIAAAVVIVGLTAWAARRRAT